MKRKMTCAVSMILAALMTASPVISSMETVLAKTSTDSIPAESTDDSNNTGNADEKSGDPDVDVSISYDADKEYSAGDSVPISVDVSNNETSNAELRLYFWDYDKDLPEDQDEWKDLLKDVSSNFSIDELEQEDKWAVELKDSQTKEEVTLAEEKEDKKVTAKYIKMKIPAETSAEFDLHLKSPEPRTITILPSMAINDGELTFDAAQLHWANAVENEQQTESADKSDAQDSNVNDSDIDADEETTTADDADTNEDASSFDIEESSNEVSTFAAKASKASFKTLVDYWDTNVNVEVVNNSGEVTDDWHESIIGSNDGSSWAYCADPTQKFWDGSFTGKDAVNQYNEAIVKKMAALMYWSDTHITCGMDDHLRYGLNTSIVWNVLNKNSGHWVSGWYYAGRGQKDFSGHNMTTHIKELYSTGWSWANSNYQSMDVDATYWYRSGSQPIITLNYSYNPNAYTDITVSKTWVDKNNTVGIRPSSIKVNLYRSTQNPVSTTGTPFKTVTLSASNNWTYTWKDLLKKNGNTNYNFRITEASVPDGYKGSVSKWSGSTAAGYKATITNTIDWDTDLTITKEWADYNNSLGARPSSVKVNLYRSTTTPVDTSGTPYATGTLTAANGWKYTFKDMPKQEGNTSWNYSIKEVTPAEYSSSQGSWSGNAKNGYAKTVTNTLLVGYLKLHKDSALPSITNGNKCYDLKGAEYTVYKTYSKGVLSNPVGTLTTNSSGDTNTLRLLRHTYYVKETKAATGYELDNTVYTVNITGSHTESAPYKLNVKDVPGNDPSGLTITKIQDGDATSTIPTLEGTQFTIKYYDGYYTKANLPSKATKTWVFETKEVNGKYQLLLTDTYLVKGSSDSLYYDRGGNPCLPYGTISIQETKPAAGYTLNGTLRDQNGNVISTNSDIYVAQITKTSGAVQLQGGNKFSGYNTPINGSVTIKKFDSDGKTSLPGVTFEIKNSKGEVVGTATTDSKGEVVFKDLYPDVYTITETETVDGHSLLAEPFKVEVPTRVTEVYIRDHNVDQSKVIYDAADDIYYIHNFTYNVSNSATFEVPMTGESATLRTFIPLIIGFALILGAGILGIYRRKKA